MIDPTEFFDAARQYGDSADNADSQGYTRCATVDVDYTGLGPARVTFDGETQPTQKAYQFIGLSAPLAGKRVVMLPVGSTYVILGPINGGV